MSELLAQAFSEAAKLPENEQDALGAWLLEEIAGERLWLDAFARSQDVLARLAEEAAAEHRRGETLPLIPDRL